MDPQDTPLGNYPSEIQELVKSVRNNKAGHLTFPQKLFASLEFVDNFQKYRTLVGVTWLNHQTFGCNVNVFSKLLGVKTNTVYKQFENFGFPRSEECMGELTSIVSDAKAWGTRTSKNPLFHRKANPQNILLVDSVKKTNDPVLISEFADSFINSLPNANAVKALYDTSKNKNALECCIRQWQDILKVYPQCTLEEVTKYIIDKSEEELTVDPTIHIRFLLQRNVNASVITGSIDFIYFYKLFLRFGRVERIAYVVSQLIRPNKTFEDWFKPSYDDMEYDKKTILVRFSSQNPSCYRLFYDGDAYNLYCDPLAEKDRMFYSDNGKAASALPELLFKFLNPQDTPAQEPQTQEAPNQNDTFQFSQGSAQFSQEFSFSLC